MKYQSDSVNHLQQLMIRAGETAFDLIPTALANVIKEKQWEGHSDKDGKPFRCFVDFVQHPLYWGLESNIDDLLLYCRKRADVRQLLLAQWEAEWGAVPGDDKLNELADDPGLLWRLAGIFADRGQGDLAELVAEYSKDLRDNYAAGEGD